MITDDPLSIPERWAGHRRFDDGMTWRDVRRVLQVPPFSSLDRDQFPKRLPLPGILLNDCRLRRLKRGDIVVRDKEYATSAFIILKGTVRVILPRNPLSEEEVGRPPGRRKTLWQSIAQLWTNHKVPEWGDPAIYGARGDEGPSDSRTRVDGFYLAEVSRVFKDRAYVSLGQGDMLGELAALMRHQRTATVVAWGEDEEAAPKAPMNGDAGPRAFDPVTQACEDDVVVLEIRWQGLRDLMKVSAEFRRWTDDLFRERSLRNFLQSSELFSHLPEEGPHWDELMDPENGVRFEHHGKPARYGKASDPADEIVIAPQGARPPGLYVVRAGLARVTRTRGQSEESVGYVLPGQAFGLKDTVEGGAEGDASPLATSLRAVGYVTTMLVPLDLLRKHVLQAPTAPEVPPVNRAASESLALKDPSLGRFLVDNAYINGTQTMLIDLERCTRCDDCVRACASGHDGNARFTRRGPRHGRFMVANACLHCRDPICMIPCPTGAIHRDPNGPVIINERTCIGCESCANACPYDAIRMVPVRDEAGNVRRGYRMDARGELEGDAAEPIQRATKCDLCSDQLGGPACQRACPHDALVRADMGDVALLKRFLDR